MSYDKYKIKRIEGEDLTPEETLADALSQHSAIETPISRGVFNTFYIFIAICLVFFIFKSFRMQIVNGGHYVSLANRNNSSLYPLSSLRGLIYDSQSKPLVENVPVFDLVAIHSQLPKNIINLNQISSSLARIIGTTEDETAKIFKDNQNKSNFVIKKGLSKEEIIKIKTLSLSGIYVVANSQRHYLDGQASAHILGYTSPVTAEDMKSDPYYLANDRTGRLGLEAQYEDVLRGDHESINLSDAGNGQNQNKAGNNLFLNINQDIQGQLYKSINSVFNSAGVRRGAAIIQNPKTGAVLGMVSMPGFDNNIFENFFQNDSQSKIVQLLKNTDKPLLDRAVGGRYSPGSTIKPLMALAGLSEGVVTPETTVYANGSITVQSEVDPSVVYTFRDWRVHGLTDIRKAIANSVDVYFYALGGGYGNIKGLGIDKITKYLKNLLADKSTGIDLPGELAGFVPSKQWKKETKGESWYVGDTYNISIGQGDLIVTPIWLNTYIGSIANGGKLMKPYLVKEIKDLTGNIIKDFSSQVLTTLPFDQKTINVVREGMRQTVLSGTATMLQDLPVSVAAKTGTAQITGRALNSLFTVFGPYDDPEVSMTILVENIPQSQGLAVRVANDFLLWYFKQFNLRWRSE